MYFRPLSEVKLVDFKGILVIGKRESDRRS